jgi:hypothetical protein
MAFSVLSSWQSCPASTLIVFVRIDHEKIQGIITQVIYRHREI